MASYNNSSYTNNFFDLNGIYFNSSTGITTGLAPIESSSSLYLLKTGGTISSNLLINGSLDVKTTLTLETIGNVATAINELQNSSSNSINSSSNLECNNLECNTLSVITDLEVGGSISANNAIINFVDIGSTLSSLQTQVNSKQDFINDKTLSISKIIDLQVELDKKRNKTDATSTFNEIICASITNNFKNIEDRDHFHYTSTSNLLTITVNNYVVWNSVKRGSDIFAGQGFVPKYTGLYSISVTFFLGTGSAGLVRVALNVNGQDYNLNGTSTFIVCANANENADSNMFSGNIVVNGVAGQYIRLKVREGTLRYLAQYSYFHGFYLGAS